MIRVGGLSDLATLKRQPVDNKSNLTPAQQLELIFSTLPPLIRRQNDIVERIEASLAEAGVERVDATDLAGDDRTFVERYFQSYVSPVISPLVIDPRHPLPQPAQRGALPRVRARERRRGQPARPHRGAAVHEPHRRDARGRRHLALHPARGRHPELPGELLRLVRAARPRGSARHAQRRHRPRRRGRRGGRGLPPAHEEDPEEAPAPAAGRPPGAGRARAPPRSRASARRSACRRTRCSPTPRRSTSPISTASRRTCPSAAAPSCSLPAVQAAGEPHVRRDPPHPRAGHRGR